MTDTPSLNHCCLGKEIIIAYSACVSVLVIQHATHKGHIVMWPVRLCNIFPHYLTNGTSIGKKAFEYKIRVLIFPTTFI